MTNKKHNENIKIDKLKKLYKRGTRENPNRKNIKITISNETFDKLCEFIPVGKGLYGSAFIELSIRILMESFTSGEDLEDIVINELKPLAKNKQIVNNFIRISKILEV